ncbi:MAG: response regulator [Pseudomonadota bacterium]|nr:response regulator [Pseudomonadota bacterium]
MRILYVEDNDDLRDIQCELLREHGYSHTAVGTAEEAEALFAAEPFDLLLTDVSLPRITGIELARRLRLLQPQLWVAYLSGYDVSPLAHNAERTRAFQKPVDDEVLADFLNEVRSVVDNTAAQRSN